MNSRQQTFTNLSGKEVKVAGQSCEVGTSDNEHSLTAVAVPTRLP